MMQFKGFKPEAMNRIAGSLGYMGDMNNFDQYLQSNPSAFPLFALEIETVLFPVKHLHTPQHVLYPESWPKILAAHTRILDGEQ